MIRFLQALVLLLILTTGWHAVAMVSMPEMSASDMAMPESHGPAMPSDCASLCLSNAHQLVTAVVPQPAAQLVVMLVIILGFFWVAASLLRPRFQDLSLLAKPPDIINLYGVYRI